MSRVDIGFLEKSDSSLLQSHFFPSKIGGKPSWLALKDLPTTEDLKCENCTQQLVFLAQIYAPYEEDPKNFHRSLFIFICRKAECCQMNQNTNLKVWRSQLVRENDFYSPEPPDENTTFELNNFVRLCSVCGCTASKHCSKCKNTYYCTREHQVYDWKHGHKLNCEKHDGELENTILFDEMELLIEEEDLLFKEEKSEQKVMEEFKKLVDEGKTGSLDEVSEDDLQNHAFVEQDKTFLQFKKKISMNPDQILRYSRGGQPLLIAAEPKPQNIPNCEFCGSERQFEFQILPQLLFTLKDDNLDWGTLIFYTCKNSCSEMPFYKREFVFKQDIAS